MNKINTFNEDLNKQDSYKNKRCVYCDRKYPETILNIEGVIHHKEEYRCLDLKSCRRQRKRKNR